MINRLLTPMGKEKGRGEGRESLWSKPPGSRVGCWASVSGGRIKREGGEEGRKNKGQRKTMECSVDIRKSFYIHTDAEVAERKEKRKKEGKRGRNAAN